MKDFVKTKVVTGLVVTATIILGGVAIFTGLRLYQLRQQSVALNAPEGSFAWDCSRYVFSLDAGGNVKVANDSTRDEPAQQAKVYINGSLTATFDVPALTRGQHSDLGTVTLPQTGTVSWRIDGTRDCDDSGSLTVTKSSCEAVTFSITVPTVSVTASVTASVTPTDNPSVTNSPTPTGTSSPTPTTLASASPTPTFPPPPEMPGAPNCTAEKPAAPILTSVKKSGTEATLTWTAVANATHYVISYGTSPTNLQYGVPNTGNVTTFKIGSLSSGGTYYFTVYAVNDCMPSSGSTIVSSVAGTSTSQAQVTQSQLPATGFSTPTLYGIGLGILVILLALALAI